MVTMQGNKLELGYLSLLVFESFTYTLHNASITDHFSFTALLLENNLTAWPGSDLANLSIPSVGISVSYILDMLP